MRNPALLVIAAAALAGAGVYGWDWYTTGRFLEVTDNAYVQSDVVTVAPKIAGYVARVPVDANQRVAAGDVLLVIDDADYRAKAAQAEAAVQAARASVTVVDSQVALTRSLVKEAEARVESARADQARAQDDLKRYKALNASQYASTQKYQAALADARKAAAAVAQATAALAAERGNLDLLAAQRLQAEAEVARAEASLQEARIALDNTVVRAAGAGVVANRAVEVGQYVAPGRQAMSVVPVDDVYVVANFKETQLARMRVGQSVALHVDAYPDQPLHGVIDSVAPGSGAVFSLLPPDNATGNFTKIVQRVPVKIRLAGAAPAETLLVPGLSVEAEVDTRTEGDRALAGGSFFLAPSTALAAVPKTQP
ncbi:HlyD family secretion protein [Caenispirillum bisanense]|uniref:Membrane fusion protein, multidrug efflux system n=1 Tax=Caenispirillum bisanense TaxID=414052 RepID=A0A286GAJ4_9PROT|nr:HlyD family secretion protein [Caenispirillum bisanense]SOD92159.1 membrane fusion protein, multidrug efflux system [Caenispirillum bisanense]